MKKHLLTLTLVATVLAAHGQTIERVSFSAVAGSNDGFQPIAGTPYGAHLSNANGSLTITAEYGENTIEESGLLTGVEAARTHQWRVYPSPTADVINVELPESSTIRLFSVTGQLLKTLIANGMPFTMSMESYTAGAYLLKVEDTTGARTYRIIKK